jgi:hypothetical protein
MVGFWDLIKTNRSVNNLKTIIILIIIELLMIETMLISLIIIKMKMSLLFKIFIISATLIHKITLISTGMRANIGTTIEYLSQCLMILKKQLLKFISYFRISASDLYNYVKKELSTLNKELRETGENKEPASSNSDEENKNLQADAKSANKEMEKEIKGMEMPDLIDSDSDEKQETVPSVGNKLNEIVKNSVSKADKKQEEERINFKKALLKPATKQAVIKKAKYDVKTISDETLDKIIGKFKKDDVQIDEKEKKDLKSAARIYEKNSIPLFKDSKVILSSWIRQSKTVFTTHVKQFLVDKDEGVEISLMRNGNMYGCISTIYHRTFGELKITATHVAHSFSAITWYKCNPQVMISKKAQGISIPSQVAVGEKCRIITCAIDGSKHEIVTKIARRFVCDQEPNKVSVTAIAMTFEPPSKEFVYSGSLVVTSDGLFVVSSGYKDRKSHTLIAFSLVIHDKIIQINDKAINKPKLTTFIKPQSDEAKGIYFKNVINLSSCPNSLLKNSLIYGCDYNVGASASILTLRPTYSTDDRLASTTGVNMTILIVVDELNDANIRMVEMVSKSYRNCRFVVMNIKEDCDLEYEEDDNKNCKTLCSGHLDPDNVVMGDHVLLTKRLGERLKKFYITGYRDIAGCSGYGLVLAINKCFKSRPYLRLQNGSERLPPSVGSDFDLPLGIDCSEAVPYDDEKWRFAIYGLDYVMTDVGVVKVNKIDYAPSDISDTGFRKKFKVIVRTWEWLCTKIKSIAIMIKDRLFKAIGIKQERRRKFSLSMFNKRKPLLSNVFNLAKNTSTTIKVITTTILLGIQMMMVYRPFSLDSVFDRVNGLLAGFQKRKWQRSKLMMNRSGIEGDVEARYIVGLEKPNIGEVVMTVEQQLERFERRKNIRLFMLAIVVNLFSSLLLGSIVIPGVMTSLALAASIEYSSYDSLNVVLLSSLVPYSVKIFCLIECILSYMKISIPNSIRKILVPAKAFTALTSFKLLNERCDHKWTDKNEINKSRSEKNVDEISEYWLKKGMVAIDDSAVFIQAETPIGEKDHKNIEINDLRELEGIELLTKNRHIEYYAARQDNEMFCFSIKKRFMSKKNDIDKRTLSKFQLSCDKLFSNLALSKISQKEAIKKAISTSGSAGEFAKYTILESLWKSSEIPSVANTWGLIMSSLINHATITGNIEQEICEYMIYTKVELLPLDEDGKIKITRLLNAPNLAVRFPDNIAFYPMNESISLSRKDGIPQVGINIFRELPACVNFMKKLIAILADFSDFDGSQHPMLLTTPLRSRLIALSNESGKTMVQKVREAMYMIARYKSHTERVSTSSRSVVLRFDGQQASGDITTSDDNSMRSAAYLNMVIEETGNADCLARKEIGCGCSGDDTWVLMDESSNQETSMVMKMEEVSNNLGWKLKYVDIEKRNAKIEILGHRVKEITFLTSFKTLVKIPIVSRSKVRSWSKWCKNAEMTAGLNNNKRSKLTSKMLSYALGQFYDVEMYLMCVLCLIKLNSRSDRNIKLPYLWSKSMGIINLRSLSLEGVIKIHRGIELSEKLIGRIIYKKNLSAIEKIMFETKKYLKINLSDMLIEFEGNIYLNTDIMLNHVKLYMESQDKRGYLTGKKQFTKWWEANESTDKDDTKKQETTVKTQKNLSEEYSEEDNRVADKCEYCHKKLMKINIEVSKFYNTVIVCQKCSASNKLKPGEKIVPVEITMKKVSLYSTID